MDLLKKYVANLPDRPGVYLFYDAKKELIYVGKATSLKNRVRSYFSGRRTPRPIEDMIHRVKSINVKEVDSALEAAILESIYIKKYNPRFNVMGRDNKSWNYIVITKEEYPRVETMRQHEFSQLQKKDLAAFLQIFGPYPGMNTKATMKILRKMFGFSACQNAKRPCLYYQMGECLGVCTKEISTTQYKQKVIQPLVTFLRGQKKRLIITLEQRMKKAAKEKQFEEAARLRDQLRRLDKIQDIAMINASFVRDEGFQLYQAGKFAKNKGFQVSKIEGYDISNLGATNMVGSLVVFEHGQPDKKQYRKFNIKTVKGQSDVDSLKEVISRRLRHDEWSYPDIFLIDGGKPQVNAVKKILREQDVTIPVIGIAKGPTRKKNEFVLGSTKRDVIRWVSLHRQLLIAVRNEAHRFALSFQRQKRKLK